MSSLPTDPLDLLELARAGNRDAWGPLLERYRHYLELLARLQIGRHLRGKVDAGDLVQETFLHAHRDAEMFRGRSEGELLHWLRRILATNLAITMRSFLGTQRRDVRLEQNLVDALDQSSAILDRGLMAGDSSPSQKAERREQAVLLADALSQLPEAYREVLILRHMEGLAFAEVAREMNRTVDSVKKLWTRALIQIRRELGDWQ